MKPTGSLYVKVVGWFEEPLNRTDAISAADTAASAVHWFIRQMGVRGYMHAEDDRATVPLCRTLPLGQECPGRPTVECNGCTLPAGAAVPGPVDVPAAVSAETKYLCPTHWATYLEGHSWWDEKCGDCDHIRARRVLGPEAPAYGKRTTVVDARSGKLAVARHPEGPVRLQYRITPTSTDTPVSYVEAPAITALLRQFGVDLDGRRAYVPAPSVGADPEDEVRKQCAFWWDTKQCPDWAEAGYSMCPTHVRGRRVADPEDEVGREAREDAEDRAAADAIRPAIPGPPCETCQRPRAIHVCPTCSPDGLTEGAGCHNCRQTGWNQTPCLPPAAVADTAHERTEPDA